MYKNVFICLFDWLFVCLFVYLFIHWLIYLGKGANIDRRLVPYHGKWKQIQSCRVYLFIYIFIYIYMHQPRSFLRRRAKVGYWGKRLRKTIRKVQKAARHKPNSKRWEKGRILKSLGELNMSLQEPVWRK